MTINEVTKIRESFFRRREVKRKDTADMVYRLSTLITNGTACIMSKDNKPIEFLDMFGDLFSEEKKINEEKRIENQIEINKQHMKDFANRVNLQRKGGEDK
ncbi:hypothetical protein [Clostridium septicum]|uniref:Uncharacterized protein n=1 Tax=Clostridium septicum TaxID=1504 RepID=A0A9N7PKB4_CLOSE|nr:hypothetical protein [Clostridium septicum]AYE35696.1 hypothetical protein CP523_15350 [Clostridium septicum]UEC19628.1 hypothetical protein LK444_09350 [Clostridium septicum]USS02311.1 hypothetical protein NH397_07825 [Clostridium septicum]WLF70895.1 hypothetical protein Q6375_07935 [Clostridium septicum]